jgi:hypothetical protein
VDRWAVAIILVEEEQGRADLLAFGLLWAVVVCSLSSLACFWCAADVCGWWANSSFWAYFGGFVMRPLCGALMTAGALIGLGLFSLGYGTRYAAYAERNADGQFREDYWVKFSQMDTTLLIVLVLLAASLMIGMTIAFVGLAYHHQKRLHEMQRHLGQARPPNPRISV